MEQIKEEQTEEVLKYVHLYCSLHETGNLIGTDLKYRSCFCCLHSLRREENRSAECVTRKEQRHTTFILAEMEK